MSHGGDRLARGAHSAAFGPDKSVSQEEWEKIWGTKESALQHGITEEEWNKQKEEARQAQAELEAEKAKAKEDAAKVPFRAVLDRVVVARIDEPEKVGQFYLPDEGKEKPAEGIVLAVGPGKITSSGVLVPPSVKVGERVKFGKFAGTVIKIALQEFLVLREEDIFVVMNSN